ncbi:calcium-binding protein [Geminocystis sp. NIES-3709]|uniref:Calx-beta domain-containing protein n=1 Tax=Geminocystis sp. NIES-3709 TaxID=1617448 RepID=UPI0005FC4D0F|nr:calcium-binding protein [Geminocystis sp. NIES-3709]BAQ65992.1 alkaline phosphatase [Geminocystis sp. NIES-3709]
MTQLSQSLPTLVINDLTITEGNSGTKNEVFTLTCISKALQPITVNYAIVNGIARSGSYYVAKTGSLSFATNETTKTISIVINGDTTVEPNETFFVNLGNTTIADSQGLDTIINNNISTNLLVVGDANNNNLVGGNGNDTLQGLGGNDTVRGGAGNDRIEGGTGADSMVGGNGNDTYFVDNTGDRVIESFNQGIDRVISSITYTLTGNVENLILSGTSNLTGIGSVLGNRITGNSGGNILNGNDGNDTLFGDDGNDNLNGGAGDDSILGGDDNDTIRSGINNDRLFGGLGNDRLEGNEDNDYILGDDGDDTLLGGTGNDEMYGITGDDSILGGEDDDYIQGDDGNDTILAGSENDFILGSTGNDILDGDVGKDILLGGYGNDTLIGDKGADTLTGGAGVDRFVFKYADEGIDRITDFNVAKRDKIVVSASGFGGGLRANANLTTAQFRLGSSGTNANQRFMYNSSTGALLFDQDGTGITPSVQIATLNTGLALTNTSIFVES